MPTLATIAPFGFDGFTPSTLLPLYRRLGCRRVQFYRNPEAQVDIEEARRVCADAGLPVDSVHGLFGPDLDPSSPDDTVRRRAVGVYREEAELALRLGGPQVVVHPAPMGSVSGVSAQGEEPLRRQALERSAVELAAAGERQGVTFLLENLPANYCHGHDPARVAELVRRMGHPRLRMCFDIGHAHMTTDAETALAQCVDAVGYLHVNDNDGFRDCHDVPGEGTLPWEGLSPHLRQMPPKLSAMLELFETEASILGHIASGLGQRLRGWLALHDQAGDAEAHTAAS